MGFRPARTPFHWRQSLGSRPPPVPEATLGTLGTPTRLEASPFVDYNWSRKSKALQGVYPGAPVVILVRTFLDQNAGAAARAMLNFGLSELRLVAPECDHLSADARARAAGAAGLLERAAVFPTVATATADLAATFATTARLRDATTVVVTPAELARRVHRLSKGPRRAAEGPGEGVVAVAPRCGIIFGPERSGLTNADLAAVDALVQVR